MIDVAARLGRERGRDLERRERVAGVALGPVDEVRRARRRRSSRCSSPRPRVVVGRARAASSARRSSAVERLEPEQRGAREQRTGEREERVLGGRADEHEQALLDVRQQRVLLGAVEAVHLVEEQDRALALLAEAGPGPLGDLAHVLHARR